MSRIQKISLGALVFVLAAGLAFYFLYFTRTPAYALNAAREAARSHDLQKVERYVDINSVMNSAFDDIVKAESKIHHDGIFNNPFALGILHMLKPAVVDLMQQEARVRIANKPQEEVEAEKAKNPVDPVPDAMRRNMERVVPIKEFQLKDVNIARHSGTQATANIILHHEQFKKDYVLELSMEQNAEDVWQIKKVTNLADLILQFEAAKKAQRLAQDQSIMDRLNAAVATDKLELHFLKDANPEQKRTFLTMAAQLTNKSSASINRMYYDISIFNEQGELIYSYPGHFRGEVAPAQSTTLRSSKALNELLPDEKRLLGMDLTKCKTTLQITYIAFSDGNVISPNAFME